MRELNTPLLFPEMGAASERPPGPPDAEARAAALDIRRSFVVEAPAGSGKTGLLIQRYLRLLTDEAVTAPEQVLAITFTKKAAGEMRDRVVGRVEEARRGLPVRDDFERVTRELAVAVLARDETLGWRLLEQPHRINLRTIDSVSAEIARALPVLSGAGGALTPTEDAGPLFREAARRTVLLLGEAGQDSEFEPALREVMLHRDGNLPDCERLVAEMLAVRDQWGMLVPLDRESLSEAVLDGEVRPRLERALEKAICAELGRIAERFPKRVLAEAAALGAELAGNGDGESPISACAGKSGVPLPNVADRERWLAVRHLLTTKGGGWRKEGGLTGRNLGFEYDRRHPLHRRYAELLEGVHDDEELLALVGRLAALPPAVYPEAQWRVAKSLFRVLRRALVELQLVFVERGQCDFTELSLLARAALRAASGREDLGSALGARLQHLLVDEMQDTSSGQYELLERLTESWDGYSQTVFLVGDPRQSIYLFRHAKVERFQEVLRSCRLGSLPLTRLRLTANFRSQRLLLEALNTDFERIFSAEAGADGIPFVAAGAVLPPEPAAAGLQWHVAPVAVRGRADANEEDGADERTDPELRLLQTRRHARMIRQIARAWMDRRLPEGRTEPWRLAVLVRARRDLVEVVSALKRENDGPAVPFRAVEIEPLAERQEILDLMAITRVLMHPADRVAGFAVLRAPWCGLSLGELHRLAGEDDGSLRKLSVQRLMAERGELLDAAACRRMERLWRVLDTAARRRGALSLSARVEYAWRTLGADAVLRTEELENARRFFGLLDEASEEAGAIGAPVDLKLIEERLRRLYAEPQTFAPGTGYVELLTMHRAKGLEWDVVMVPALERGQGITRGRLLTWAELDEVGDVGPEVSPVMLAPIAPRGEQADALTKWLRKIYLEQEAAERKRLFYVAATRARKELHLFASPDLKQGGEIRSAWDSLLKAALPAAEEHLARAVETVRSAAVPARVAGLELAAAATVLEMPGAAQGGTGDARKRPGPQAVDEELYPAPVRPEIERMPASFDPAARFVEARERRIWSPSRSGERRDVSGEGGVGSYARPEGSFAARALGTTVHAMLELAAARMRAGRSSAAVRDEVQGWGGRVHALLRAEGIAPGEAQRLGREVRRAVEMTLEDSDGAWLLGDRDAGATEVALSAAAPTGELISIRVDRTFLGGAEPQVEGNDHLWIVDYKTGMHSGSGRGAWLEEQRKVYAAQLERYAEVLARMKGIPEERVRVALYYPLLPHLAWWSPVRRESEEKEPMATLG